MSDWGENSARETVAQWMIRHSFVTGHGDTLDALLTELSGQIRELRSRASKAHVLEDPVVLPPGCDLEPEYLRQRKAFPNE